MTPSVGEGQGHCKRSPLLEALVPLQLMTINEPPRHPQTCNRTNTGVSAAKSWSRREPCRPDPHSPALEAVSALAPRLWVREVTDGKRTCVWAPTGWPGVRGSLGTPHRPPSARLPAGKELFGGQTPRPGLFARLDGASGTGFRFWNTGWAHPPGLHLLQLLWATWRREGLGRQQLAQGVAEMRGRAVPGVRVT